MKIIAMLFSTLAFLQFLSGNPTAEGQKYEWKNDMILFKNARPYMPEGIYTKLFLLQQEKTRRMSMLVSILPVAELGYYYEIYNELRRCNQTLFEGYRGKEELGTPISEIMRSSTIYDAGILSLFESADVAMPPKIGQRHHLYESYGFFSSVAARNHRWIEFDKGWRIDNQRDKWSRFRENMQERADMIAVDDRIFAGTKMLDLLLTASTGTRKDLASWLKFIAADEQIIRMLHPLRAWYAKDKMNSAFESVFDNISNLRPESTVCVIIDWRNAPAAMEMMKIRGFQRIKFEKELRAISVR